ncbi:Major Facilitator Superfamily protein [Coccidioides posadasii C735 delta SOWgp]|uniref:Major Facilitator Superfamily protein n=1 Tax=Coccidioides posadasii (strain C735) TaxID=222929 RepID=C5PJP6_COCP7|nr:Major Facilitator Superfamily protein [Coccidioides posadasii C735 delta SOWgp]EER22945.1 Major Facilitator Superfamily protein [Coccidioides posadasii C735 delta SOWgp]|eukprot:XP_003065090.1 Major Facilitator Superfamily protein [Coccidioides posadasii C735 delta SOWgp]
MGSRFESRDDLAKSASSEDELNRPFSDGSDRRRRMSDDDHRSVQSGTPDLTGMMSEASRPPLEPPFSPSRRRRRYSYNEEDETTALDGAEGPSAKPVSWRSLPKKGQLAIITVARLAEPLAQTSLQAYMFHQVKSFDPSLPDSTVSTQAGILQGCFTAAQFATGVIWGRLADTEFFGRKRVLLIGLFGACLSSVGFGLSKSFAAAVVFRILGGALNSNAGVMRAMIAEIIEGKEYQSRAFLLLPMCFNTGMILGPILGGILADPVKNYPGLFGPGSLIGGKDGVWWMKQWPYALPNFISALFMLIALVAVFLGLDEPSEPARSAPASPTTNRTPTIRRKRPPFRQVWTRNVLLTLLTHFVLPLHTSAFNALCFLFLPAPRAPNSREGLFLFGGGLGMPSSRVGLATAIIGIIGLPFQILVYPRWQFRLGTLRAFRVISRTFSIPATVILVNNSVPDPSVLATVHGVAQSVACGARAVGPLLAGWGLGLGLKNNIVGGVWWALALIAILNWALTWTIFEGNTEKGNGDKTHHSPSQ